MSKEEARKWKCKASSAAGNVKREVAELERLQEAEQEIDSEIMTITVGCGGLLTLICC